MQSDCRIQKEATYGSELHFEIEMTLSILELYFKIILIEKKCKPILI